MDVFLCDLGTFWSVLSHQYYEMRVLNRHHTGSGLPSAWDESQNYPCFTKLVYNGCRPCLSSLDVTCLSIKVYIIIIYLIYIYVLIKKLNDLLKSAVALASLIERFPYPCSREMCHSRNFYCDKNRAD